MLSNFVFILKDLTISISHSYYITSICGFIFTSELITLNICFFCLTSTPPHQNVLQCVFKQNKMNKLTKKIWVFTRMPSHPAVCLQGQ